MTTMSGSGEVPLDSLHRFMAYGLRLGSDMWLPPLDGGENQAAHGGAHDEALDVYIARGVVPEGLGPECETRALWQVGAAEALLTLEGLGRLHVQAGSRIICDLDAAADVHDLAALLWGSAMPVLLAQRGQVCLRGTAVCDADGALLLLGESGAGKSALGALLLARGMRLVSDGGVVLTEHPGGGWQVLPGIPALRMWPDGGAVPVHDSSAHTPLRRGVGCAWRRCETVEAPRRLRHIVRLVADAGNVEGRVETLSGMRAYEGLAASLFPIAVAPAAHRRRGFDVLSKVAREVPLRLVDRVERDVEATRARLAVVPDTSSRGRSARRVVPAPLLPVSPKRDGCIWLASYPKSGNTWMRALLSGLLEPEDGLDLYRMVGGSLVNARLGFDLWSGVESAVLTAAELERLRARYALCLSPSEPAARFIKVHNARTADATGSSLFPRAIEAGGVYIVRNPLDVAVSFAHHRGTDIDRAIADMADPACTLAAQRHVLNVQLPQRLLTWSQHVASWLDSDLPLVVVRYEDLLVDPAAALEKVCALAGLAATPAHLATAVEGASFARLQALERMHGFPERGPGGGAFFREGRAGGWRQVLSAEQVARIISDHGPTMARLGYLPSE